MVSSPLSSRWPPAKDPGIGACGAAGGPCQETGDCQWFFGKEVPKGSPIIDRHIATATSGAHLPSLVPMCVYYLCVNYCSTYYKAGRVGEEG